ncbi:MAG: cysteine--tRNA ligase [Oscillochloris sp.]|nr:cysteine--tRNA ligase [Oscillochloris sp.]
MIQLYNTLTRQVELFTPLEPGLVKMYSCGPTVYRSIHIGNLRTFLMADWLRRSLLAAGLDVQHVKNITDVGHMRVERLDQGEDKMLAQARREGKTSAEIAAYYTAAFRDDEARMNILPANVFPRATDHIPEMLQIIQGLEQRGHAYAAGGNVFFDIRSFADYGRLSGNLIAQLLDGARDTDDTARRNPEDFPLWKVAEPGREMAWDSPYGRGFPGWHIECSAMAMKHLGEQIDIHTGGVDNIFPHHEGELAQSEGFSGKRFVQVWVHARHLLADGLKMAKSTGNAYTLSEIAARGFEPMALRYLFATVHYRGQINFTFSALRAAQTGLERLRSALLRLAQASGIDRLDPNALRADLAAALGVDTVAGSLAQLAALYEDPGTADPAVLSWHRRIGSPIADDLGIPQALAALWKLLRGREPQVSPRLKLALVLHWDAIFGLQLADWLAACLAESEPADPPYRMAQFQRRHVPLELPAELQALLDERTALRAGGRYDEADGRRAQLAAAGYTLRDTRSGTIVERRPAEDEFRIITRSHDVAESATTDRHAFSVNLLARDSRDDLERCVQSVVRHCNGRDIELVIVDSGSTDDSVPYLQQLVRSGLRDEAGNPIPLTVLFADHNLGFAAGRNAAFRASSGRTIVMIDTSIELNGDIWTPIEDALAAEMVGYVGPYGLATNDLKEFYEVPGPQVDAVEGYLIAFRRAILPEIGYFDEKFRFYRLLDIHHSFYVKTAGYDVITVPEVAARIIKHPHREWYSLGEEERATKSKKNYDIFRRRWHHGENLMTINYDPAKRWFGHDHPNHLGPEHDHSPAELPSPGVPHTHKHRHWPDHDHEHPHVHKR